MEQGIAKESFKWQSFVYNNALKAASVKAPLEKPLQKTLHWL